MSLTLVLSPILSALRRVFSPSQLFSAGEQGVWYDPSDINLNWRRNLLTYSEAFDNAAWGKSSVTVTANTTTAPDGTTTADSATLAAGTVQKQISRGLSVTGSGYLVSFYFKTSTLSSNFVQIALGGSVSYLTNFDISTGALGTNNLTGSITSVGSGWYRAIVLSQAAWNGNIYILAVDNGAAGFAPSTTATGDFYIWGAQLEVGSTATAYQKITDGVQDYYTYQAQPVLFQDSAGTTPVTAVEQPVGLMLDKSKGLALGPELITNSADRDFSSDTGFWGKDSGVAISGGTCNWTNVSSAQFGVYKTPFLTAGVYYEITYTISSISSGSLQLYLGGNKGIVRTTVGVYVERLLMGGTTTVFSILTASSTSTTASIDNVSIKQVTGNHAFQSTSTKRPLLSARYNLLTKTEQFDDAVWVKTSTSITPNAVVAPDGTLTAELIYPATSGTYRYIAQVPAANSVAAQYKLSVYVKPAGKTCGYLYLQSSAAYGEIYFDLSDQSIQVVTGSSGTPIGEISTVGSGWYKVSITSGTAITFNGSAGNGFGVADAKGSASVTASGTSGIYIWGADLRVANDGVGIPAYQRVNTSTDYDTVGFKPYLKFDGVDDALATNSIDFTAGDKMTVIAGVRKLSDATAGMVAELSANYSTNSGVFFISIGKADGTLGPYWGYVSKGTSGAQANSTNSFIAPITNVLASIGDISGSSSILRINSTQNAINTAVQGTGNYGNYPLFVGSRAGTSLPFNGCLYSLVVRGAQSTDAQIAAAERWVNKKTGAY